MLIALDYDDTYTRDPEFWNQVIDLAKSRGHEVICATMRYPQEGAQVVKDLGGKVKDLIFTSRQAKKPFVNAAGYYPNIWIDDNPFFIINGALR